MLLSQIKFVGQYSLQIILRKEPSLFGRFRGIDFFCVLEILLIYGFVEVAPHQLQDLMVKFLFDLCHLWRLTQEDLFTIFLQKKALFFVFQVVPLPEPKCGVTLVLLLLVHRFICIQNYNKSLITLRNNYSQNSPAHPSISLYIVERIHQKLQQACLNLRSIVRKVILTLFCPSNIMIVAAFLLVSLISLLVTSNTRQLPANFADSPNPAAKQLTPKFLIFGVRWMLGNHFSLPSSNSNQYYVLMFNSKELITGDTQLYIESSPIACSYRSLPLINRAEYIYRCNVNYLISKNEIGYRIVNEKVVFDGAQENQTLRYESNTLYQSKLRTTTNQLQPLFLGNLDISNPRQLKLLSNQLDLNKSINLLLSAGNFFPQLSLTNYGIIMLALQPITSMVPLILLNVNPIRQSQNFIFSQLLYTPQSQTYSSYFWLISMPSNVVIMAINPIIEVQASSSNQDYADIRQSLEKELDSVSKQIAEKQSFLILLTSNFSHFADSSLKNSGNICSRLLKDNNFNLYLSSSSQGYYRTQLSSQNSSGLKNIGQYSFDNPIRINQGNNYLLTDNTNNIYDAYLPAQGFGVLQFDSGYNQPVSVMNYLHISFNSGKIQDNFTLNRTLNKDDSIEIIVSKVRKVTIAIEFIFLFATIVFILYAFIKIKLRRASAVEGHVQMVQQLQNNQQSQLRAPIT